MAELYQQHEEDVLFFNCDNALAIKFSIPRPVASGDLEDGDCFGGQQYAPLLEIEVPVAASSSRERGLNDRATRTTISNRSRPAAADHDLIPITAKPAGTQQMTKTIYLANPYGFSAQQKALLLPRIVEAAGSARPGSLGTVLPQQSIRPTGAGLGLSDWPGRRS